MGGKRGRGDVRRKKYGKERLDEEANEGFKGGKQGMEKKEIRGRAEGKVR